MPQGTQSSKSVFSPSDAARGTRLERLIKHPLVQFVAFSSFVGALVGIVAASSDLQGPAIDEQAVGEVASSDLKANRDFTFTQADVAATNKRRKQVADSVPPVFDWQEGLVTDIDARISRGFAQMRTALADRAGSYLEANQPARFERIQHRAAGAAAVDAWVEPIALSRLVSWSNQLRDDYFDPYFDVDFSDATFEAFAHARFSKRSENALHKVVDRVLAHMIVADLDPVADRDDRGVYLRRLRGDKLLIEYHITDVDQRFVPLSQADALVRQAVDDVIASDRRQRFHRAVRSAASALVRPNTTYNEAKTVDKRQAARQAVSEVVNRQEFRKGQVVVEKGHIITDRHVRLVNKMLGGDTFINRSQVIAGITLLVLLLVVTFYVFGRKNVRHFRPSAKDVVFLATSLVLMLALTWLSSQIFLAVIDGSNWGPVTSWYFLIPVAAGGMLIRLVLNNEHAVVFTVVYAALVGLITDASLPMMTYTIVGALVGIGAVQQVKHRLALLWSGLAVGAINVSVALSFILLDGDLLQLNTIRTTFFAFASGVMSGFFVLAVLPLFETVFGYTTDIKLLELANLNHPLLRELIIRSPGSYHHSMMVGSLGEAAAERVGANPLLCRVGAYYHDIGKTKNPQYFAENQKVGENPHDKLKPNMSALIIKAHVKDGLEMARQHRLPTEIQDFIAQHHGTSLIAYFYHKAKQMEDPDIPEVDQKDYRYPGPKPQSRETAICMLSDGIEAASRALPNPSPARLKGLVQKMINKAFTDGQLDECDLTLKDLNSIAKAFTRILTGIYHHRPEYPGQTSGRTDAPQRSKGAGKDTGHAHRPGGRRRRSAEDGSALSEGGRAGSSDASSDVWQITKEKVESMQRGTNARRRDDSGDREQSSEDPDSSADDSDDGRQSLPRLGTS